MQSANELLWSLFPELDYGELISDCLQNPPAEELFVEPSSWWESADHHTPLGISLPGAAAITGTDLNLPSPMFVNTLPINTFPLCLEESPPQLSNDGTQLLTDFAYDSLASEPSLNVAMMDTNHQASERLSHPVEVEVSQSDRMLRVPREGTDEYVLSSAERAISCHIKSCRASFDSFADLQTHNEAVHAQKFHCTHERCPSSYKNSRSLRRHEMKHQDARVLRCPHSSCGFATKGFDRKEYLYKHLRRRH